MRPALLLILVAVAACASADPQGLRRADPLEELRRSLSPVRHKPKGRACVLLVSRAARVAIDEAR